MFNLPIPSSSAYSVLNALSSARDEYTGKEGVFLDANENPLGSTTTGGYNRYPDPHQWAIKHRLAPIKGVRPEQIFLGNGSDEPIDLLVRATCTPGNGFDPDYAAYLRHVRSVGGSKRRNY